MMLSLRDYSLAIVGIYPKKHALWASRPVNAHRRLALSMNPSRTFQASPAIKTAEILC
jgi:hypothetical protein